MLVAVTLLQRSNINHILCAPRPTTTVNLHLLHGGSAQQSSAVASVGSDPAVLHGHGGVHSRSNGFLSVIQVAESADVARLWRVLRCILIYANICKSIVKVQLTLYSVSFTISILRMVYICLKYSISSSLVVVTLVDGASQSVFQQNVRKSVKIRVKK